jgi:hypothetical protein
LTENTPPMGWLASDITGTRLTQKRGNSAETRYTTIIPTGQMRFDTLGL